MLLFLQCRAQGLGIVGESVDVLRHEAVDGRMQVRVGQAFDLVDVIRRHQFAGAGPGEITEGVDVGQGVAAHVEVSGPALAIFCKGGMGLVADAGLDVEFVDAVGNLRRRGAGRKTPPLRVLVIGNGHRLGREGNQLVGAFEVVVLQGRLVDLPGEDHLVGGVGLRRVQVFGA